MLVRPRLTNLALFLVLFLGAAVQPSRALPPSSPLTTPAALAAPVGAASTATSATATLPISVSATASVSTAGTPIVTATASITPTRPTTSGPMLSMTPPATHTPVPVASLTVSATTPATNTIDTPPALSATPTGMLATSSATATTATTATTVTTVSATATVPIPTALASMPATMMPASSSPIAQATARPAIYRHAVMAAVTLTGIITTVAGTSTGGYNGDGLPATQAWLNGPAGVALDRLGNLFIADTYNNRVREVMAATGLITTVAGTGTAGYNGDGIPAIQAEINSSGGVDGLSLDGAGNLLIADAYGCRVRRVGATGGQITAASLIATATGTGSCGYNGDVQPAGQAQIAYPHGVVADGAGDLYIADDQNNRVREVVAATGQIITVAGTGSQGYSGDGGPAAQAQLWNPADLALDGKGDLFIADSFNNVVREVLAGTGIITTVAGAGTIVYPNGAYSGDGGPARQAQLSNPQGVAVDGAGNLFISDSGNNVVREALAGTGIITTVVGTGSGGYNGDGIPAVQAQLNGPVQIALDGVGNLYISDHNNGRVREVVGIASPAPATSGVVPWRPHRTVRLANGLSASVDLADGHLDLTAADVNLPARGPDLSLAHTWDSQLAQAGVTTTAGQGWNTSLTARIGGVLTGTVVFTDATGAQYPFVYTGNLTATSPYTAYAPTPGQPWALTATGGPAGTTGYTLTDFLSGATMAFDGQGRSIAAADAYGNANTLSYTGGPGPSSMANSGGRALRFSYSNGLLSETQSPLWVSGGGGQAGSQHVAYGYTPGTTRLQTLTTAAGTGQDLTTTFGYSGALLTSVTTPYTRTAHTWSFAYDALGRVTDITSPVAAANQPVVTHLTYSPGQTVRVEGYGSPAAVTTTYTLDAQGEPLAIADPLGHTVSYQYDGDHDVTSAVDARGNTTAYAYTYVGPNGSTGLLAQRTDPPVAAYTTTNTLASPVTTYAYNPTTYDVSEVDSPEGGRTLYGYDAHHTAITTTQLLQSPRSGGVGCPQVVQRNYAQVAARTAIQTLSSCVSNQWRASVNLLDGYGEITGTVDGRGVVVSGNITPTVALDPINAPLVTRRYAYTPQGDLSSVSTPPITTSLGGGPAANRPATVSYGVDADGNRTTITSPNGAVTTVGYDHLGRATTTTRPSVGLYDGSAAAPVQTVGYDGDGNVAAATDADNDTTTRSYDPLGRVIALTNPLGRTALYTYTATTLAATQDYSGNVTQYGYDAAGRLLSTTDPLGTRTQAALDALGNTTAITTPLDYAHVQTATVEQRGYDALNRVVTDGVQGTGGVGPTAPQTSTIIYDKDGNVLQRVSPAGSLTNNTYDMADRLASTAIYTDPTLSPLAQQSVVLDPADNPVAAMDLQGHDHHALVDGANRVSQATDCAQYCGGIAPIVTTPGYDPDGNVLALTQTVGSAMTTTTAGYNTLDWLTSQNDGQGTTVYGYDAAGRLRTQSLLGGAGAVTATLDAAGRTTRLDESGGGTAVPAPAATLGYTVAGGSADSYDSYNMDGSKVTTGPQGARVTSLTAYVGAIDPNAANDLFQTAIYADSNGSPGALVAASASGRLTANSWNTVALTVTLAPSTTYWLVYNANGSASQYDNLAYANGPAGIGTYYTNANQAYGVWPATFGAATSINDQYSLYATSAGGVATLGYTRTGSSQDTYDSYNMDGSKVTTGPRGGQVVSLSAYVGAIDPNAANDLFQTAIYADSNGSPGALVAASASGRLTATSWNTVALTATLAPSTTYWLMYNANGSTGQYNNLAYDSGPAGSGAYYAPANQAYGVWPTSFGAATSVNEQYSLYATTIGTGTGSGSLVATSDLFGYTPDNLPLTDTLDSGVVTASVSEARAYDGANRVTGLQVSGASLAQGYGYGYDPQGHTVAITTSGYATQQLTYDAHGWLQQDIAGLGGTPPSWQYDANGNLTQAIHAGTVLKYSYAVAAGQATPPHALPNELVSTLGTGLSATGYSYDNSGNTAAIVQATNGYSLTYDAQDRLTTVVLTDTSGLGRNASVAIASNARGLRSRYTVTRSGQSQPAFDERLLYRARGWGRSR